MCITIHIGAGRIGRVMNNLMRILVQPTAMPSSASVSALLGILWAFVAPVVHDLASDAVEALLKAVWTALSRPARSRRGRHSRHSRRH